MLYWDDLRFFLAVADHGSLSAAARALRVNPATILRHIDALEFSLSARCFDRKPDGYVLTATGGKMLARVRAIEGEVRAIMRGMDDDDRGVKGRVVVSADEMLAEFSIVPRLPLIREQYPGIRIDLLSGSRSLDLARGEADIALRLLRPETGNLVVRRVGTMNFGVFASKKYIESHGEVRHLGDLSKCDIIDWVDDYPDLAPAAWWRERTIARSAVFRADRLRERLIGCAAGVGIAMFPLICVGFNPELVQICREDRLPAVDIWLLARRDLARVTKIRAVIDFLVRIFARDAIIYKREDIICKEDVAQIGAPNSTDANAHARH